MNGLDEAAQRILAELEEAGHDNIFALLNTISEPIGKISEVQEYGSALRMLLDRNLITLQMEGFYPHTPKPLMDEESASLLQALQEWFRYDQSVASWLPNKGDMRSEPFPVVHLSIAGRSLAQEILKERGYQWWREGK